MKVKRILGIVLRLCFVLGILFHSTIYDLYIDHIKVDFSDIKGEYNLSYFTRHYQGKKDILYFNSFGSDDYNSKEPLFIGFFWYPYPEFQNIMTYIPVSMIKFVIEKNKTKPTVEFVFKKHVDENNPIYLGHGADRLKQYLMAASPLRSVIIKISQDQLAKEDGIPSTIKYKLGIINIKRKKGDENLRIKQLKNKNVLKL